MVGEETSNITVGPVIFNQTDRCFKGSKNEMNSFHTFSLDAETMSHLLKNKTFAIGQTIPGLLLAAWEKHLSIWQDILEDF